MEVVLAKPQTEKKTDSLSIGLQANHLPNPGYGGFIANPYGSMNTGYGVSSSFQQVCSCYLFSPLVLTCLCPMYLVLADLLSCVNSR